MINRIGEIISPEMITRIRALGHSLINQNYPVVEDLIDRLIHWIEGDDRAEFILTNYQSYGFYYFQIDHKQDAGRAITLNGHAGHEYMTWYINLRNLFTDEIILSTSIESLNGSITSVRVHNAGFQPFQLPNLQPVGFPNYSFVGNVQPAYSDVPNFKIIYTKPATQFVQTITPGEGGGGLIAPPAGGGGTNGSTTTNNSNDNSITDFISQYGLYIGLGLLAFFMFNKKNN